MMQGTYALASFVRVLERVGMAARRSCSKSTRQPLLLLSSFMKRLNGRTTIQPWQIVALLVLPSMISGK